MHGPSSGIEVAAHRGASADAPEHTWAAYELALAVGADVLELDLRATADGELVVLHDPTLARTVGDPRRVDAVTLAELGALAAARRPLPLDAVLARYGHRTRFLLELKEPQPPMEARLVEAVAAAGIRDRVVVQSFDEPGLRRVRALDPELRLAPLYRLEPRARLLSRLDAVAAYACAVGLHHRTVDAVIVRRAHDLGLRVRAYTVNAPAEALRLVELGVDGLITDAPGRVSAALRPVVAAAA